MIKLTQSQLIGTEEAVRMVQYLNTVRQSAHFALYMTGYAPYECKTGLSITDTAFDDFIIEIAVYSNLTPHELKDLAGYDY